MKTKKKKSEIISEKIKEVDTLEQCNTEFKLADEMMSEKKASWYTYLKLYNNLKRDKEAVGNNLLYTLFNTLLSYLYFDKLQVDFNPRESGDVDKCELVSNTAKFDYEAMGMPQKQYDWIWDSLFFGTGFMYIGGMKDKVPQTEVIDPFTVYIDPHASSIDDARFFIWEKRMTKWEMEKRGFQHIDELGRNDYDTKTRESEQARKEAKNEVDTDEENTYVNKEYVVLEWYTHQEGKLKHFFTDYNRSVLLTPVKKSSFNDGKIPVITKSFSPIPHEMFGLSVPDLVEDKQRASAILINLGLAMEKSKLYPQYLYDRNAIININDLKNFQFNKFIPAEPGGKSIADIVHPLQQQSISNSTNVIYEMIRDFAERTVGTPDVRQGFTAPGRRSATELQLTQMSSDTRSSLSAKLFTLSEIKFWQRWLNRYIQYNKIVADKVIRIQGALGVRFVPLTTDTFNFKVNPDIVIESTVVSSQKKMLEKQSLVELSKVLIDKDSTIASKRFYKRKLLRLSDFPKDEIEQILPPTFDELRAQEENKLLEKGKMPEIEPYDDHYTHIITHNTVIQNKSNKSTIIAHIQAHKKAYLEKKQEEKEMEYEQSQQSQKSQQLNKPQPNPIPNMPGMPGGQGGGITPEQKSAVNGAIEGFISKGRAPFEQPQTPINQNPLI